MITKRSVLVVVLISENSLTMPGFKLPQPGVTNHLDFISPAVSGLEAKHLLSLLVG